MIEDILDSTEEVQEPKRFNWWFVAVVGLLLLFLWNKYGGIIGEPNTNPPGILIVEERDDRDKLPIDVLASLTSTRITEWLDKNNKEYRIVDQEDDLSKDDPIWSTLKAMPRTETPWIYISNPPHSIVSQKLEGVEATLELLERNK